MRHRGFVKAVSDDKLIVTIISQSACSSCHAQGACSVSDFQDKEIEISEFKGIYKAGQEVTVIFRESKGFTALFWGYILPFLIVLITLIVTLEISGNELKAGLLSLGVLIPYYTTLYFLRHHLKKIFKFEVEETI
ncbi:SoxR reducing system RseC family protein [Maribellus sediminis]|uniref:SoxR reducing system RseC family protein n=1 Tax=Maribellus sediminis TaxID=2696285 RepID=UPI003B845134